MRNWVYLFIAIFTAAIGSLVLFVWSVHLGFFGHLYTKKELASFKNAVATRVYSADGQLIGKYYSENRTNVRYEEIPLHVVHALIATEDVRYFEHEGVDSKSLLRVIFKTVLLNQPSAGGGSTITQQLLKNMYGRANYGAISMLVNKTKEALLAHRIEEIYTKEEILALYLNTVPFGENVFGIEAAARLFFNKGVSQLSITEGAVLIGMLKANTYYNPRLYPAHALSRRNVVLSQMEKYAFITANQLEELKAEPLELDYDNLEAEGPANYFLVHVQKQVEHILEQIADRDGKAYTLRTDGLIVTTTLREDIQLQVLAAMATHLARKQDALYQQYQKGSYHKQVSAWAEQLLQSSGNWERRNMPSQDNPFSWSPSDVPLTVKDSTVASLLTLHAGVVALNPHNGAVLAYVGGINFRTHPYDQVYAQRQMASTFKPILYASALENGFTPCTYLSNTPKVYKTHDNWYPSNYDQSVGGKYSMAAALRKSKNIPAVNLYDKVGFEEVDYLWRRLGFSSDLSDNPSSALGTVTANIMEVARAYAAFANGGDQIDPYMISEIKSGDGTIIYTARPPVPNRVMDRSTAQQINTMLESAIASGTGQAMRHTYGVTIPLAGKTGTSQNFADAWFAAYNPSLVFVTRVGASTPKVHFSSGRQGSGGALALPIVGMTLQELGRSSEFSSAFTHGAPADTCADYIEDNAMDKVKQLFQSKPKKNKDKQEKKKNRWKLFKKKKK